MKKFVCVSALLVSSWGCVAEDRPEEPVVIIIDEVDASVADVSPDVGDEPDVSQEPVDVLELLRDLETLASVVEVQGSGDARTFALRFTQPVDHFVEGSPTFTQFAVLIHRSEDAPVVMVNSGYGVGAAKDYQGFEPEAATMLGANTLFLGHRFFTGALPAGPDQDWSTVTIEQAAADNHLIVETLKSVYQGPWVGTGWSKGGMTVMFHERFHPDDLDLALPMVAPLSFSPSDQRYQVHMDGIGTPECRADLDALIRGSLGRVDELGRVAGISSWDIQFYIATFPWTFWQSYGLAGCARMPDPVTASAEDLVSFFIYQQLPQRPLTPQESGVTYYYQAMTQLGYQLTTSRTFLQSLENEGLIARGAAQSYNTPLRDQYGPNSPWGVTPPFDYAPMRDVHDWLREDATDVLAIYGAHDPWTGGKVVLDEANGSKVYIAPSTSHGTMIQDLDEQDFREVEARIMGLSPSITRTLSLGSPHPGDRELLLRLLRDRLL